MKKLLTIAALAFGCLCHAQQVPQILQAAINESRVDDGLLKPTLSPKLTYSSKNYTEVFGRLIYSIDAQNSGGRIVYVGANDKFYYNNINFISDMPIAGQFPTYSFNDANFVGAVLSVLGGKDMTKALTWSFKK